jgi:hypothetical protein
MRTDPGVSSRRRLRVAALLVAAAPVAVAFAPIQIWAQPGPAPASTTLIAGGECHNQVISGAPQLMKHPNCAGD